IWNAIDHFRAESSLYTWLYKIAGNEAITYINKQKKRNEIDISQTSIQYKGTNDVMETDALVAKLQLAIDTLPDKQK
ncbi:MAG TPA: sigma factor, partial [Chitinophagales bacterium]|nr:sigma factor [Chitinophagales bacterium]